MTEHQTCILVNYITIDGGEMSSKLTSKFCCTRLKRELDKDPYVKKLRQSIGGIHKMDSKPDDKGHWIKTCPYCKSKIRIMKLQIHQIPYDFIQQKEIQAI